jgi:uncharacterized OB-fold protein
MFREECPFCGAYIHPIKRGSIKKCPACGREWYEVGGGGRTAKTGGDDGGGLYPSIPA